MEEKKDQMSPERLAGMCADATDKCPAKVFFNGNCPQHKECGCTDITPAEWYAFLQGWNGRG